MQQIVWQPDPGAPQEKALITTAYETLYGGARGGGKTDAGIAWLIKEELLKNPRYRALVIRKNADDLRDWVDRAMYYYQRYNVSVVGKPPIFKFPSGAKIITGHLKDDNAYTKYQGHEYQRILIEELTQIGEETNYLKLLGSCRSTIDIDPRIFCTTNPGGVGHQWVKKRFIDQNAWGEKFVAEDTKRTRIFIPAKVEDNRHLVQKDPGYLLYLESLRETYPELYKAWRLGDWDTFAGQFFKEFSRQKHVMRPFEPNYENKNLTFIGGLDWGRAKPFAFLASVVYPVRYTDPKTEIEYNFVRCITYKEVYGVEKTPAEWGEMIKARVNLKAFKWIQCDNQIYAPLNDKSMSIFEQFAQFDNQYRVLMKSATKDRVGGWVNMHNWLSIAPDGLPYWMVTENCQNTIRTIPMLIHDDLNVEDVDSEGEDHAPDAARYQFSGFRWIDGKLGGIRSKYLPSLPGRMNKVPLMALDLDRFTAKGDTKTRDWRGI